MPLQRFDPPANLDDFDSIDHQREAWSEFISDSIDSNIQGVNRTIRPGASQFYNPTRTETQEPHAEKTITWIGFPALIARRHPDDPRAAREEADALLDTGERPQDEYLEWHVEKENGKIVRVTFTCEGPEYWEAMAHGYPLGYTGPRTAGGEGDKEKVLALYRQFISPEVNMDDLFVDGEYNRLNVWNTEKGAMHLNQRNNTLGAEINIAAFATIKRKAGNRIITDADELIRCARFGAPGRASDPTIGAQVNALARDGFAITLLNPVGLYIDSIDTAGWTKPDGTPVSPDFWRILRGSPDMIVRAVYEVPEQEGFTVGDIKIGGERIEFGGQIAEHITVKLTGVACRRGEFNNSAFPCIGAGALADAGPATEGAESKPLPSRF